MSIICFHNPFMIEFTKSLGLNSEQANSARSLYEGSPSLRKLILETLSKISLPDNKTILPCDLGSSLGNTLCVICLKYSGASEEDEPFIAANFLLRATREENPLPRVSEDKDLGLCAKTLFALSLFLPAMKRRYERRGAPHPSFYRKVSQGILYKKSYAHKALARHHEGWENFIFEQFAPS